MKAVYNWLKDFVDVTANAAGTRLAPRAFRHEYRWCRKTARMAQ